MIFKKLLDQKRAPFLHLLEVVVDSIEGNFFIKDTNGVYKFVNSYFCKTFDIDSNEIIGKDDYFVFPPEVAAQLKANDRRIMESKTSEFLEESGMWKGKQLIYRNNKVPLIDEKGEVYGICGVAFDITYQKSLEQGREKLIIELQKALAEIKTLRGILPVCCVCGLIRDDNGVEQGKGEWMKVDKFVIKKTDARVSHTYCPKCCDKAIEEGM
jgi:PAS domain S-box-containing protein